MVGYIIITHETRDRFPAMEKLLVFRVELTHDTYFKSGVLLLLYCTAQKHVADANFKYFPQSGELG